MAGAKTIFRTLTTETSYMDLEGVGTLRYEGSKIFRWVKNPTTNVTFVPGNVVCHKFSETTGAPSNIYTPATADLAFLAGIVCGTFDSNTGTNPKIYGWVQTFGEYDAVSVSNVSLTVTTGMVAGMNLVPVNGAVYAGNGQAMGTAPVYKRTLTLLAAYTATSGAAAGTAACTVSAL